MPHRLTLTCDGAPLLDWTTDYSEAGLHADFTTSHRGVLALGLWGSTFRVYRLVAIPLPPRTAAVPTK